MGLLVDGQWVDRWYDTESTGGRFKREPTTFHGEVTRGGESGFQAEPGRYHLYVSYACPWAHRTLIFRKLKKLEDHITLSVVHWFMGEDGWTFQDGPGVIPDHVGGAAYLREVYTRARPDYTGRVTVPILWDRKTNAIVNNESSEIIRMLNTAFDQWGDATLDFWPEELRGAIEEVNDLVYPNINNGVYRAGFATTQDAYEEAVSELFDALDEVERRLSNHRFLVGDRLTEADWRLFTTLIRFDKVYHGHFKCNVRRIVDYPNLWAYTRDLYQVPGVAETVHFDHITRHYYQSHESINPTRVVAVGPDLDLEAPHGRGDTPALDTARTA